MDLDYKHIVDVALVYFQNSARWDDPEGKDIYSPRRCQIPRREGEVRDLGAGCTVSLESDAEGG